MPTDPYAQWKFILHLVTYAREKTGDDLLSAALEGRELTPQSVFKLLEIAEREFGSDLRKYGRHIGNGQVHDAYRNACLGWLEENGVANAEKMLADKFKPDPKAPKITEEFDFEG